jgi:hypothetical protein
MKNKMIRPAAFVALAVLAGCGGSAGTDTNSHATTLLASVTSASTPATSYYPVVQQLYIAYFGRPADPGGLASFAARLAEINASTSLSGINDAYQNNDATIRALVDGFGTSKESAALYSGDTDSFVRAIFANVLNRAPLSGGLSFWVNAIDNNGLSRGSAALAIMVGALGNITTAGLLDAALVNNKTSVGSAFTTALADPSQQASYAGSAAAAAARAMLASVTSSSTVADFQSTITSTISSLVVAAEPGAPIIGAATAGDASASIAFTAPTSSGISAITGYTATCTSGSSSRTGSATASPISVTGMTNNSTYACSVKASNSVGAGVASGSVNVTPVSAVTTTAALFCAHTASIFNSGINLTNTVTLSCSSTLRTIVGNGVPDHTVGTFPNSGNPNSIKAVTVNYSNTLTPAVTSSTGTSVAHKIGYANNSVSFDPATAESYQSAGVWKIEALNQTYFPFGVDASNAHVQPDGTYHYHGIPEGYLTLLGKGAAMTLVGFAVDGFPIYARYGYTTATSASSAIKVMTSSYRIKTTPSSGRPSTSIAAMGTFTQDYEYVAGLGDLDECNGRTGVTPEFPNGIYHYYITDTYPYIQRCVKGTPSYNGTIAP